MTLIEQRRNLVLQGTESFSRGALDNVALENGSIVLDSAAGNYLQYGCYTTPEYIMPAFSQLSVSWNAEVPDNTLVHMQCRIFTCGAWSGWLSFGKWAPSYPHGSVYLRSEEDRVELQGDTVKVLPPAGGTAIQLRISLSTNDEKVTPAVRLLAASARPVNWKKRKGRPINRVRYLPGYTVKDHVSEFGAAMDLPLVIASLMNHFGEDILPEEMAYLMRDMTTGTTDNVAYAAAAASSCGYLCRQAWMDVRDLRAQLHDGCPVAVQVHLGWDGPLSRTTWMGLRGFVYDEPMYVSNVCLMDPGAESGSETERTMALDDFMECFTGRAIVLGKKPRGRLFDRPRRLRCELRSLPDGVSYCFEQRGEADRLPRDFQGWIACTLPDGRAYATTAHKTFRPMLPTPEGGLLFPRDVWEKGGLCSVYAVDLTGSMRVAELRLPAHLPPVAEKEAADPAEKA